MADQEAADGGLLTALKAMDPFSKPPEHVNEAGFKFWLDRQLTDYARGKEHLGPSYQVLLCEEPSGRRTRLFTRGTEVLRDYPSLEGMAIFIDIMDRVEADFQADEADAAVKENKEVGDGDR